MNRKEFDLLYYFAKSCGIKTLGELAEYKRVAKCRDNDELLDNLSKTLELIELKGDSYVI